MSFYINLDINFKLWNAYQVTDEKIWSVWVERRHSFQKSWHNYCIWFFINIMFKLIPLIIHVIYLDLTIIFCVINKLTVDVFSSEWKHLQVVLKLFAVFTEFVVKFYLNFCELTRYLKIDPLNSELHTNQCIDKWTNLLKTKDLWKNF